MSGGSYSFRTYFKDKLTCEVWVSGWQVKFKNYSDNFLWLPFGVKSSVTYQDLLSFYEDRCFPKERANCKTVLKTLDLDVYDVEMICRKTHGTQFDDFMWIQFSDEPQVTWDQVKLRD